MVVMKPKDDLSIHVRITACVCKRTPPRYRHDGFVGKVLETLKRIGNSGISTRRTPPHPDRIGCYGSEQASGKLFLCDMLLPLAYAFFVVLLLFFRALIQNSSVTQQGIGIAMVVKANGKSNGIVVYLATYLPNVQILETVRIDRFQPTISLYEGIVIN
jgi:hypothetical protein